MWLSAALTLALLCAGTGGVGDEGAGEGGCPPSCSCGDAEGEKEYTCGGISVRALADDFAKITCKNVTDLCSELPPLPISGGGVLPSIGLYSCPPPATFACLLRRLGATAVTRVTVEEPQGEITSLGVEGLEGTTLLMITGAGATVVTRVTVNESQGEITPLGVEGLEGTTLLMITGAVYQTTVPYDVLDALPSLTDFRLRGGRLHLPPLDQSEAFPPHPALKFVELSSDGIEELPRGAFLRLRGLPQLHLWDNKLRGISNDSFMGMDHLESLDLSRNPLQSLPVGAFSHSPRLRTLTLVANRLKELEEGVVTGLEKLEKITMKFNAGTLTLLPRSLSALPSLSSLSIDRCALAPLPADLLRGDHALKQLAITESGVGELPGRFFEGLGMLEELNLKENKLKVLDKGVFRPLKALKTLNLDGNLIEVLPSQLFAGLKRLTAFTAERNRLHLVAGDALRGAVNLAAVSLAANRLAARDAHQGAYMEPLNSPFSSLLRLRSLVLRDNRLSRVSADWRLVLTQLEELDLSKNLFTEITKADVQFLASNITVDLRHNQITTVDVIEAPPWWPYDNPTHETNAKILLDDNPYKCDCELFSFIRRLKGSRPLTAEPKLEITNAQCSSPPQLKNFSIKRLTPDMLTCKLRPEDCPKNCTCDMRPTTQALELDCNEVPTKYPVPSEFGVKYMSLTLHEVPELGDIPDFVVFLNLSGVGLTDVANVPETLKVLDLSHNLLNTPPEVLSRNVTVYLKDNPFVCDCSHYEDVVVLQKNMEKILDFKNITCNGKESPWRVNTARLCDVRRAAALGGVLAALGVIIAVLAALAYKYSLEIRVFLFSKGWCIKLLREEEFDQNMVYDAFVSFSQKDAQWVAEELIPKLENEHNIRLCVHFRDWLIGDMIPAQIARSVEQSRRTIIVLSRNFLESSWALLEFRAAHLRAEKERKARVLVVVLEMPPQEDMDAELRAYLSTNTYLKWGDPWFWEKLIYALPHSRRKVVDKLQVGGLQARLTADGKIVNDALKVEPLTKY